MLSGLTGRRPSLDMARAWCRSTGESMYWANWRKLPPSSWCVSASTIVSLSKPRARACLAAWARWRVVSNSSIVSARGPLEGNSIQYLPHDGRASARSNSLSGVDRLTVLVVLPGLKVEQLGGVAAQDVALGLFGQERQVVDRRRQIEVPVRVVGREAQLGLG